MNLASKIDKQILYNPLDHAYTNRYFNAFDLFTKLYHSFPSWIELNSDENTYLSYDYIISVLIQKYSFKVSNSIHHRIFDNDEALIVEQLCDLGNGLIVHFTNISNMKGLYTHKNGEIIDNESERFSKKVASKVLIYYGLENEKQGLELAKLINETKLKIGRSIQIICKSDCDFYTTNGDVKEPKNCNLTLNYGSGFDAVNTKICDWLNDNTNEGIILLHGPPGTGKTSNITN
jgi:hypothetical protein